jgi:hypothetical protein
VLRGNSHLTEFDGDWKFRKELSLPSPIVSFALMEGRPMGVGTDRRLAYLDAQGPGFTFESYPPPWLLFTAGPHRLGILRREASTLHLIRGEDEISLVFFGADIRARKPFAAAAGPGDKIYLLASPDRAGSASVIECDEHLSPRLILDFALPDAFHPRMIGITSGRIYLADAAGEVAFYPLDPKPSAGQVIDSDPHLLSDMEPVREAARRAGFDGRIEVDLEVNEDGRPQHVRVQGPMARVPEVMDRVQAWQFRPAIRSVKATAVPMEVSIDVH